MEVQSPAQSAQNWKLTLSYDGTGFNGWQIQPDAPTIQGELQAALCRITGESPLPQGSGRTDAGVHALAQVASFELHASIPAANLQLALNRTLPAAIRVLEARTVPPSFHARHSAIGKTYEYRVFEEKPAPWPDMRAAARICPPFLARWVACYPWPLELEPMQQAARLLIGTHDFTSFAASDPELSARPANADELDLRPLPRPGFTVERQQPLTVKTIHDCHWLIRDTEAGRLLVFRVHGSGFLHHMVRNLVGTLLDVGRGHTAPNAMPAILAARQRAAAGPTAPASGLFLHSVDYGGMDQWETPGA